MKSEKSKKWDETAKFDDGDEREWDQRRVNPDKRDARLFSIILNMMEIMIIWLWGDVCVVYVSQTQSTFFPLFRPATHATLAIMMW